MPTMLRLTGTNTPSNVPNLRDRDRFASRASSTKLSPRCRPSTVGAGGRRGERSEASEAVLLDSGWGSSASSSSRSGETSRYRDAVRGRAGRPTVPSPSVGARRLSCCWSAPTLADACARKRDSEGIAASRRRRARRGQGGKQSAVHAERAGVERVRRSELPLSLPLLSVDASLQYLDYS